MSQSNRKVVAELTKVWESVISKGKDGHHFYGSNDVRKWISDNPAIASFQSVISHQVDRLQKINVEETKKKVGRLMTTYEELIGMKEVRSAHERVLSVCQNKIRHSC